MKKILVTGKDGQVGWELQRTLASIGQVIALDRAALNLVETANIKKVVDDIRPDIIINTAAYTAVDKAESDQAAAMAVNGVAPGAFAEAAKKHGALYIHYSTDYVFDGSSTEAYVESDKTSPLNMYGETKLAGEKAIEAVGGKYLIFRTSWIYGSRGKNFLLTMLRLAKERDTLKIVDDQTGAPTWCRMIAEATANVVVSLSRDHMENSLWGLYHLTSSGRTTWFAFAKAILEWRQMHDPSFQTPKLLPISTAEYPLPAKRPMNSVLSNQKIKHNFDLELPDWKAALWMCMEELSARYT